MPIKKNTPGCATCDCSGGGGVGCFGQIPQCFCSQIPPGLIMTSADTTCNFMMFQDCTISYGPHPGFEALNFGTNYFLSDEGFPDPVADGAIFYYALLCQFNQFSLTRAYLTSPYGSPFRDGILYTWLVGGSGNSCGSGSGGGWLVGSDYLAWAACADSFLNANFPGGPGDGNPWQLSDVTVDPGTGCITGQVIQGDFTPFPGLGSACGVMPRLVVPTTGTGGGGFGLTNGMAFPGSDPTCSVSITS